MLLLVGTKEEQKSWKKQDRCLLACHSTDAINAASLTVQLNKKKT
jgi:hypothetical protein